MRNARTARAELAQAADQDPVAGSPLDSVRVPRTYVVMLAAVAGLGLGILIVYFDYGSWSQHSRDFAKSGPFSFWLALICAQTMLWTVALPPLIGTFRHHWRARRPGSAWGEVVPSAIVLTLLVTAVALVPSLVGSPVPDFIPHRHLKILMLTAMAFLVALVAAMSIWLIRGRAEALRNHPAFADSELVTYLRLRADLEWLLTFLGAVIGLAVFASAALRNVVLSYDKSASDEAGGVIVYGFVLSLIVALIYLPTYATLHGTGARIRDSVEQLPQPGDQKLEERIAKRKALDDLLGLQISTSATFRIGVAILSPLLGSLTSLLPNLSG
jgi:hypothetical protein